MSNHDQQIDSTGMGNMHFDEEDDILLGNDPGLTTVNTDKDFSLDHSRVVQRLESIAEERSTDNERMSLASQSRQDSPLKNAQSFENETYILQQQARQQTLLSPSLESSIIGSGGYLLSVDKSSGLLQVSLTGKHTLTLSEKVQKGDQLIQADIQTIGDSDFLVTVTELSRHPDQSGSMKETLSKFFQMSLAAQSS